MIINGLFDKMNYFGDVLRVVGMVYLYRYLKGNVCIYDNAFVKELKNIRLA